MSRIVKLQPLQRYALSGSIIFVLGHVQYRFLYTAFAGSSLRAGVAWGAHFIIGAFWSHAIHRGFTFRYEAQQPYIRSLVRTFAGLVFLLGVTTLMMLWMCDMGGLDPALGWFLTTAAASAINYIMMSRWTICTSSKE